MMENWTITCKSCGNNHAKIFNESEPIGDYAATVEILIRCFDCGKEEAIVSSETGEEMS